MNIAPVQAGCCVVCRRAEHGLGYAPPPVRKRKFGPVVWGCEADVSLLRVIWHMPKEVLNRIESEAVAGAMEKVGGFLDGVGKSDLAALTYEEFMQVGVVFLDEFGKQMRDKLGAEKAPF